MPDDARIKTGLYKAVADEVREFVRLHAGERFDLDVICRQLAVSKRETRKYVAIELKELTDQGKLEKLVSNSRIPLYRVINKTIKIIDWVNAKEDVAYPVNWPYSHIDGSRFGFDGLIEVDEGEVIVGAGVTNSGKTCLLQNLLWENMDIHHCKMQVNEYSGGTFKRRVSHMDWASPLKEDGTSKFDLIDMDENWIDILDPDAFNIIDWVNLPPDTTYDIGPIVKKVKERLTGGHGMAAIAIQKDASSEWGRGRQWGAELAALYVTIDFNRLTVKKVKKWTGYNTNNEMYGFEIVADGTQFQNIRRVVTCRTCHGSGQIWRKGAGQEKCGVCIGVGYLDARESEE